MRTPAFPALPRRGPVVVPVIVPARWHARFLPVARWVALALLALAGFGEGSVARAQTFLENRPGSILFNLRSTNGVPTSSSVGNPVGSNGKAPTATQQQADGLTTATPTAGQFTGAAIFSAVVRSSSTNYKDLGETSVFDTAAKRMLLPRGMSNGVASVVLRQAQVGTPFLGQQVSFLFGSVIPTPPNDESGIKLTNANYWLPEPFTTVGHTNAGYYWSDHAQLVYAVQPGPVFIVWQKAAPAATTPSPTNGYVNIAGSYYRLQTNRYVVSGAAAKPPRRMYWTEGVYSGMGKKISVPSARVNDVKVVYNSTFPQRATEEYQSPGQVALATNVLQELRTLWFDRTLGTISAYNREGRVFVELLGDLRNGEARYQLGYEIVDVYREISPDNVTTELGEIIKAFPDGRPDAALYPDPIVNTSGVNFTYRQVAEGRERPELYATRETQNLNDFLVHWLETGEAGLKWPFQFTRYKFVWPSDPAKYSHYIRPAVDTEAEARLTAVQLPSDNAPLIDYQDPLDYPRGKVTDDFKYYTYLDHTQPAHRALLRFIAGEQVAFERIFSWRDTNLKDFNFGNSVAENLTGWSTNAAAQTLVTTNSTTKPRVFTQTVEVGQRITAPAGESSAVTGLDYLAGHIQEAAGTSYSVSAYLDPFVVGFDEAQRGAIIPVNSLNDAGALEVWWFRPNLATQAKGVKPIYWPSAIGRYNLTWPAAPSEIVLASNDGSGGLGSLEASGRIYFQNDPAAAGYNPNEEHALMQGGQIYALRDDLNITNGSRYSSRPFVLLEYTAGDGRPAIRPFKVLREKGDLRFNYTVTAGTIMQPPMPLPLLEKPLAPPVAGASRKSVNSEFDSATINSASGTVATLVLGIDQPPIFQLHVPLVLQDVSTANVKTSWMMPASVDFTIRTVTGSYSTNAPYLLSFPSTITQPSNPNHWKFAVSRTAGLAVGDSMTVTAPKTSGRWTTTVISTNSEAGSLVAVVDFGSARPAPATNAQFALRLAPTLNVASLASRWRVSSVRRPEDIVDANVGEFYSYFTYQDRKGNVWAYRGPNNEGDADYVTMQFYYKTLAGFNFPAYSVTNQPTVGTITPYLRPHNGIEYVGDGTYGNANNDQAGDRNSLPVYYRAVWPDNPPILQMGESLALPKRGLPSVRGQSSLAVLYQQAQAEKRGDVSRKAVVLHDPTREKVFALGASLGQLPAGVKKQTYQGKVYFPNLPPHLAERFYFDPSRGAAGALVFKGEFVDSPVGEDYLLLNVLGAQDARFLADLCPTGDTAKSSWDQAVTNGLSTTMVRFIENTSQPGTFIPSTDTRTLGPDGLAEVWHSDVAVDSYALTAVGPGTGFVVLISGNGRAFTGADEPTSLHVVKVVNTLYRGEVKPVLSSNPLNEKVTLQQVADLAGQTAQYEFQWLITSPVDGGPPAVYQNTRELLLGDGTWKHIRYPLETDAPAGVAGTATNRYAQDVSNGLAPVNRIPFSSFTRDPNDAKRFIFTLPTTGHLLTVGNSLTMRNNDGVELSGRITTVTNAEVTLDTVPAATINPASFEVLELEEQKDAVVPQAIVYREFTVDAAKKYSQLWLSLDLADSTGANVYLDGQLVVTVNRLEGNTASSSPPASLTPLSRVYRLGPEYFSSGTPTNTLIRHTVSVELFSTAVANQIFPFNLRLEGFVPVDQTGLAGSPWLAMDAERYQDGVRAIVGGTADVRSLADNYLIMRYRATNTTHASYAAGWSSWTEPQLVEGWIKRVLAGINPFNQRVKDLFENRVNTDVSILTQAGQRWEGDVALNLASINNYGLIEIYETVLRRGRGLSIDAGINFGPANDALMLAAGYLNDLYVMLGNEAADDAANPTIGIGSTDAARGDIASALFAFKGQTASLLEEELALLRGRDDFLQPGVETAPVYNRLFWNYTRGIDAGEVIYALNYNIKENNDTGVDGVIDADDARKMFPQGHGDAYGHYLTALKGYYSLLLDTDFDWVPRVEAVTVLGKAVTVDYQDERKFAAAAAGVARTGKQVFDLTWRRDYVPGDDSGWEHFSTTRDNPRRSLPGTRYWGTDHWATRTMLGAYVDWVTGNAIVPAIDPDPAHEGIQKIQRDTVPELTELTTLADDLQSAVDNAEAHLSPVGLPEGGLAFDINPAQITGENAKPHFEQIYDRAKGALGNALAAFDDAKDVTREMRAAQDSLSELQTQVGKQELAYEYSLIELYGAPYSDDVGPGLTYATGYTGPDLLHFMYVDNVQLTFPGLENAARPATFKIDMQQRNTAYNISDKTRFDFIVKALLKDSPNGNYSTNQYVSYTLDPHGFFQKPAAWKSRRASPGKIQDAIGRIMLAHNALTEALSANASKKYELDRQIEFLEAKQSADFTIHEWDTYVAAARTTVEGVIFAAKMIALGLDTFGDALDEAANTAIEAIPKSTIVGVAAGGDLFSAARSAILASFGTAKAVNSGFNFAKEFAVGALKVTSDGYIRQREADILAPLRREVENKALVVDLETTLNDLQTTLFTINQRVQELDDAFRNYQALLAQGDRIMQEREIFRQRSAALVQGYRTRDAAFRIFRNEKLERYKTLFDLAARYAFIAANAYDYETGLLGTDEGKAFVNRIVNARALGVVRNGEPQYAGSNTGDPGLSSVLAEMKADWDVLKGRLGFNNPDAYGTTVSLRTENFRTLPGAEGDQLWKDILLRGKKDNLLEDEDVRRYCMQIDRGDGLPVPGLILDFQTTINDTQNLFGRARAAGDHWYSPSSFATKIFGVGIALEGYKGMDDPTANSGAVGAAGATSPGDPSISFLSANALGATPYIYLIPVGVDSMRSPPLGDESAIRSWSVADVTVPLPFNIGASGFSTKKMWQSSDSLTEQLFGLRKHQAFRPVSTTAAFSTSLYGNTGQLQRSQFTNNRLIGRSVWNSKWKLVIPGRELLSDPKEGLDRFVQTVRDIKLHFVTYSYSGN